MKIGILTYHTPRNFGANLQAYASSNYFTSLGHDVKVINYLMDGIETESLNTTQGMAHWEFSQNKLRVTRPCVSGSEIFEVVKEEQFDLVLVGSDAVWGKRNRERLAVFHCSWLWGTDLEKKVKVAAMSPAFMGQHYNDLTALEKKSFEESLKKFIYLNTRDEWTRFVVNRDIMNCEYITKTNPDPVFLLDKYVVEEWKHPESIEEKKYIVISLPIHLLHRHKILRLIRKFWNRRLLSVAHSKGYSVVELPLPEGASDFRFDYTVPYPIDPIQWYLWLKNAKGFFGDRFHAVVSCCSSGTSFLSYDGYGYTPKWVRFLNVFGVHRFDSTYNISSKIRNLLLGSGLEQNRFIKTEISLVSPKVIMKKLLSFDYDKQTEFREKQIADFTLNMQTMLRLVENGKS